MARSSQSITATKRVANNRQKPTKRALIWGVLFRLAAAALLWAVVWGAINPTRAIPPGWNPLAPLQVSEPVTLFTNWRLARALDTPETCIAALSTAVEFNVLDDFEASDQCHIRGRVDLAGVGQAQIDAVETTCAIALRMAMWEQHSLQPAADELLDTSITGIDHIGSYNCREIRTTSGGAGGMSTHATAEAIDIAGFRFSDGTTTSLVNDWDANDTKAQFLRAARDGACDWFQLTLSPDYNDLHADHFHLQSRGWGSCR
ncbi:MAG: hypothetical protein ACJAXK_002084 [Yoonia sp.]|jgi:hypothetical protein